MAVDEKSDCSNTATADTKNSGNGVPHAPNVGNFTPKRLKPPFDDLITPNTIQDHFEKIIIPSNVIPHAEKRKNYLIDVKEEILPPQIAISLFDRKLESEAIIGTLGDFSLIIGKAKSRKSFLIGIAVATALSNGRILNRFKNHLPVDKKQVLYFDTEQSKYYVQKAVKRICHQINESELNNLSVFNLRSLEPSERLSFIETEIYSRSGIGFVVIDGIKDLIKSINDEGEATMIASKLLKWSEERNVFILTVLHQNKSDNNARGHIGTELINKALVVLSVSKSDECADISIVEPQQCRDKEPEVFAFTIDENGIPVIAEDFELRTERKKNQVDFNEISNPILFSLLNEVYSKGIAFGYSELVNQIKFAYKKQFNKSIGVNRAKELITLFKNNKWLVQEKEKGKYTQGLFEN